MTTLARLSFRVPVGRMDEFAERYAEKLVPMLAESDLVEFAEDGRKVGDGFFCRLFELENPADFSGGFAECSYFPR